MLLLSDGDAGVAVVVVGAVVGGAAALAVVGAVVGGCCQLLLVAGAIGAVIVTCC